MSWGLGRGGGGAGNFFFIFVLNVWSFLSFTRIVEFLVLFWFLVSMLGFFLAVVIGRRCLFLNGFIGRKY